MIVLDYVVVGRDVTPTTQGNDDVGRSMMLPPKPDCLRFSVVVVAFDDGR